MKSNYKHQLSVLTVVIICVFTSYAQDPSQKIWIFGKHAGLDFNSSPPAPITNVNPLMVVYEHIVSQCDAGGNLVMYAGGLFPMGSPNNSYLFDKDHNIVNLPPNVNLPCPSLSQGFSCLVPQSSNKYFVGTPCPYPGGLNTYSIVQIGANGYIDVNASNWNISIPNTTLSEGMTGVPSCDDASFMWIIGNGLSNGNIEIFKLHANGSLSHHKTQNFSGHTFGPLQASPDGTYIAISGLHNQSDFVYDFDRDLGELSNQRAYGPITNGSVPEFSPNSRFLYWARGYQGKSKLYQIDLANECLVSSTQEVIISNSVNIGNSWLQMSPLAPDHKIYLSTFNTKNLSTIHKPNRKISNRDNACNFVFEDLNLGQSSLVLDGFGNPEDNEALLFLPNNFDAINAPQSVFKFTYTISNCQQVDVTPKFGCGANYSVQWDYGDGTPLTGSTSHFYQNPGEYVITANTISSPSLSYNNEVVIGIEAEIYGPSPICSTGIGQIQTYNTRYSSAYLYNWNVVGGVIQSTNNESVDIAWNGAGYKEVSVTIDDLGCSNCSQTFTLEVKDGCIIYVDENATSGQQNGSSWPDAFLNLQDALSVAQAEDEIWVAQGTYDPDAASNDSYNLIDDVSIFGGFTGIETIREERNFNTNVTVLSGNLTSGGQSKHVVESDNNTGTAILDGFKITQGNANGAFGTYDSKGGGILIKNGSPTIRNCWITRNNAIVGAGIAIDAGSPLNEGNIYNCKIESNSSDWYAGGIYIENGSDITIYNSIFCNNSAYMAGGAIYIKDSDQDIINCNFDGNDGGIDGGNTLFTDNAGNSNIYNSISWDPTVQSMFGGYTVGFPPTHYVNVENSDINTPNSLPYPGNGNILVDPNFYDGCNLKSNESALYDAGDNSRYVSSFYQFDYEDNERFAKSVPTGAADIDIGAYEYKCPGCRFSRPSGDSPEPQEIQLDEKNTISYCRIFPNPVDDLVNVEVHSGYLNGGEILIYDITGKSINMWDNVTEGTRVLDISSLNVGIYQLCFFDESGKMMESKRLIKK